MLILSTIALKKIGISWQLNLMNVSREKTIKFSYTLQFFKQFDRLINELNQITEIKQLNNATNKAYQSFTGALEEKSMEEALEQLLLNVENIYREEIIRLKESPAANSVKVFFGSKSPLKRLEDFIQHARKTQKEIYQHKAKLALRKNPS